MKLRPTLLLLPAIGGLLVGALSPARAAATDPVTGLVASAAQTPGAHDRWNVTASWAENGAARYSVVVTDAETGGVTYAARAAAHSPVSLTTDALIGDHDFWVRVQPEGGDAVATSFHTPALDTTAPTASYRLDRTSAYLTGGDLTSDEEPGADFVITQVQGSGYVSRTVVAGDGSPAAAWKTGDAFVLSYAKAGVYTPHVLLVDQFANTRDVALPAIRVLEDSVAPTVRIQRPAKPGRASSWRVVRGTASDDVSGVAGVVAFVLEKRGSIWWAYDFGKRTWVKGTASRQESLLETEAEPALAQVNARGRWRTPAINKLQKGLLHIEAVGVDGQMNIGRARPVNRHVG